MGYVLEPLPGYDVREIAKNPTINNSVIREYRHGRLEYVYPTTPETLHMFFRDGKPRLPPSYYADERVGKINLDKPLPEDEFATGVSPFLQVVYRKAAEMNGATLMDLYRAVVSEHRIAPDSRESMNMVKGLVKWASGSPGFLVVFKEGGKVFYRSGKPMTGDPPLIPFRRGIDPIEDQVCYFVERKGIASYGEIKGYIINGLGWLTSEGYLKRCIDRLVKRGNLVEFMKGYYKFLKMVEPV